MRKYHHGGFINILKVKYLHFSFLVHVLSVYADSAETFVFDGDICNLVRRLTSLQKQLCGDEEDTVRRKAALESVHVRNLTYELTHIFYRTQCIKDRTRYIQDSLSHPALFMTMTTFPSISKTGLNDDNVIFAANDDEAQRLEKQHKVVRAAMPHLVLAPIDLVNGEHRILDQATGSGI